MRHGFVSSLLDRISDLRESALFNSGLTFGLVITGPMLVFLTFYMMQPIQGARGYLRFVLTADFVYILFITTLLIRRLVQLAADRRAESAGSRLHFRLTTAFGVIALFPTVLVALFAVLSINQALEGWFSERVRSAVGASLSAAQAYQTQIRNGLMADTRVFAQQLNDLNTSRFQKGNIDTDSQLSPELTRLQTEFERGLKEVYIINNIGELRLRGLSSYLFGYEKPTLRQIKQVEGPDVLIITDLIGNELRALIRLSNYSNHYLYLTRTVDGSLLGLLEDTTETATYYNQLETERGRLLFDFGLLYLAFAVILILTATWLGLWFAERLASPVGRMTAAAQKVGAGDLDARIENIKGDDEIAMLARYFNQMTHQLKGQRDTLIQSAEQADRRRRLFDSVLASVTSGVIGLDQSGHITFLNKSAQRVLDLPEVSKLSLLSNSVPEFREIVDDFRTGVSDVAQREIRLLRRGKLENLLVRIALRTNELSEEEGYVIAFEDVTDLVSAQRMAAWGDVARRIAHEIKNPLTPIRLSAERIKRKFSPKVGEESDQLENMTDVIVRQTDELRRIVDEFSQFARMPEPDRRPTDFGELLKGAILLQESGQPNVIFKLNLPNEKLWIDADSSMIGRAITNLLKNSGESIEEALKKSPKINGEIRVVASQTDRSVVLTVVDNGTGLPEDRSRLLEPYVTNRQSGTGLGLSIVVKTIEEHGGTFSLSNAEPFGDGAMPGAQAVIKLPKLKQTTAQNVALGKTT
ncbi:MAG: PAS domain-containing sensor histidine kinase [Planktomarina sp.]|nr:PAS domain-containing sensor histidine kinase [Planktomarina sp.]MDT2073572.1 PAS domain-containing sensor histidine kinase [Planktomarina sp.]|tara:strand:+ start:118 stop:2376 length:2259 start_codon:yes stop_codon:yes gene_type:complete